MEDVTSILRQIEGGQERLAEHLLPVVYAELRQLAAVRLRAERADHTLQPTALVHEAYLRLVDIKSAKHWDSRSHFFSAAAEAMRRILVEHARRKNRRQCGPFKIRHDLQAVQPAAGEAHDQVLAVHEALNKLAVHHPEKAELVKLRFFAGMTLAEAAETLGFSTATADRYWKYARAWLGRELFSADAADES